MEEERQAIARSEFDFHEEEQEIQSEKRTEVEQSVNGDGAEESNANVNDSVTSFSIICFIKILFHIV
jgi:hypothetical protein